MTASDGAAECYYQSNLSQYKYSSSRVTNHSFMPTPQLKTNRPRPFANVEQFPGMHAKAKQRNNQRGKLRKCSKHRVLMMFLPMWATS